MSDASKSEGWKPTGYTSVSPYLVTNNAEAVIDFLCEALGAKRLRRYDRADGSIMHAEVRIDDSVIMIGQPEDEGSAVPSHLHVYVPDVDSAFAQALEAGGKAVQQPTRQEGDPDRRGGIADPGGNTWWLSTQLSE